MNQTCNSFYDQVMCLIRKNYYQDTFNTAELAKLIYLDRTQLYRKLMSSHGVSASKLIQQVRLQQARRQILKTQLSLHDIAYQCGYKTYNHFSNSYKKFYQESPSDTRKNKQPDDTFD